MSSPMHFRIIIVGGGIAGLAAAIALRKDKRHIIILEQSRLSTEIGATISLQPNATRILQQSWGLSTLLEDSNGMVDHGFRIYNVDGKMVNEIPLRSKTQYGADRIMWHRQDLHAYLRKMATSTERRGEPAILRTSARVASCDCREGKVILEDGEVLEGDLVIGADGIHSALRTSVLSKEIKPKPTGSSAYRLMLPTAVLNERAPQFAANIKPEEPYTSMVMAHSCRLIMGPARDSQLYSVVGLVPDERMNEDPDSAQSWVTKGDSQKMLDTFKDFPGWTQDVLRNAESIGLWQLRDIDPLEKWHSERTILIGDAAHAMLPTQGQGASQTIEDAEALGTLFDHVSERPSRDEVSSILAAVFKSRYERASLIQQFSREAAKPATEQGSNVIKMRPDEFMDYNCTYRGEQPSQIFSVPLSQHDPNQFENNIQVNDVYLDEANADAQALLDLYNTTGYNHHTIPAFFEQIMVPAPDFMGVDYLQPPPDLAAWMPEVDWLGTGDIFGNDFTPAIDQMLDAQASQHDGFPLEQQPPIKDTSHDKIDSNSARRRHAAFKQSAWFWIPQRNQHAFSEHENIILDERNVDLAASPHMPYSSNVVIPDQLSAGARDRIFQLISKTARSQITIPSFPSADCVDKLIKVGIAKRTETDAWIHPYLFESETARPEYLTALVAAGCVCFGIPAVSKTGLALQEIVRVALNNLSENDNSVVRDLEYLQACMLWLDIGAFCGYRRKMEIAESSLQSLVTALRRAGRLDYVRYPTVTPSSEDSEKELHAKWKQWVEQESYKRLAYHLFEHDMHMTMTKHRPPLITYAELTLALPASRTLWLAPSAEIWRSRYLDMHISPIPPSLRSLLKDESAITCLPMDVDVQIARSTYLHGIAAQIWEHAQQSVLLHDSSDPSSQLWARSRQQKLYQCLQREDFLPGRSPAVTSVFHQFLQMFLHVNLDTITRFAGKCGETAANSAYTHLSPWSQTKEARIAIHHAGQVLRAARHIPPYQIRGPDSFMIYHAIMVLWTYSMMVRDRAKKTGTTTPLRTQPSSPPSKIVYLDDATAENQGDIDAFILTNQDYKMLT
ncbi:hypothetical protein E8E12_005699 [Didymella heteroderae]|uniref:FAD-binding domain-containing protein n=1 Tax=Didymella heteroderae TaxID=1769908 RepID=A0A9P4WRM4_9PLEO|nr:hypothetical protein E8E12_005699 [Didymella heteroderae]